MLKTGKSSQLNEVFYRMMVDYYEGLAKIEAMHTPVTNFTLSLANRF